MQLDRLQILTTLKDTVDVGKEIRQVIVYSQLHEEVPDVSRLEGAGRAERDLVLVEEPG